MVIDEQQQAGKMFEMRADLGIYIYIWHIYIWYNNSKYALKRYKHTTMDSCKLVSSQWSFRPPSAEPRTREPRPGVSNGAVLHCQMLDVFQGLR